MCTVVRLWLLGSVLTVSAVGTASASAYNIVADFKISANPHGPWSFYSNNGLLMFPTHDLYGHHGWRALTNNQIANSTYTYVAKNTTGQTITQGTVVAPTHALAVVSGNGDAVDIEFRAPVTGVYRVKIEATGIQTNEESHPLEVASTNHILCEGVVQKYQQVFQCYKTTALKQGEILALFNGMSASQMSDVGIALVFNVKGPVKGGN